MIGLPKKTQKNEPAAGKYESSDVRKSFEQSGLVITHEQATDTYTEGTVDDKLDHATKEKRK